MKLVRLNKLLQNITTAFLRFPLTILAALVAVCSGLYLVEFRETVDDFFPFINILLTAALGIPLFFATSILGDKQGLSLKFKFISHIITFGILLLIYWSLPGSDLTSSISLPYIRYTIFNLIAHLIVSFIPYIKQGTINGFWNYNRLLLLHFSTALSYSIALYAGLSLALTTLELLFNLEISIDHYFEILIVIIGGFNTWFFVAQIPQDLNALEHIQHYPKTLKIFGQYILLPLLVLYLAILYVYSFTILLTWNWPKGVVSYLIICIAAVGIIALLLMYPYGNLKENRWIKTFTKFYYYLLLPLVVILFMAITLRIEMYGVTINRYLIVLLGIWLSIVSVYFSTGQKNIKFIPISLAIILILTSFGPWSMFRVGEASQVKRLKTLFEANRLLTNGKFNKEVVWNRDSLPQFYPKSKPPKSTVLTDSVYHEMLSIIHYLGDHHGFSNIKSLFDQNVDSLVKIAAETKKYISETEIYMRTMGLRDEDVLAVKPIGSRSYSVANPDLVMVKDYDYLLDWRYNNSDKTPIDFATPDSSYTFSYYISQDRILKLQSDLETVDLDLNPILKTLKKVFRKRRQSDIPNDKMNLKITSRYFEIKLQISYLDLMDGEIQSAEGFLLFKQK